MAKKPKNGKQRTREHIIADLAFNHLERHVLRCGYTVHRVVQDYGLDAAIRTFSENGIVESGAVWIQLKASDSVRRIKKTASIGVRVQRRDLLSWVRELYPVILVIYDGKQDHAHWIHVQSELSEGKVFALAAKKATATLHIPSDQLVTEQAVRSWRDLKNENVVTW